MHDRLLAIELLDVADGIDEADACLGRHQGWRSGEAPEEVIALAAEGNHVGPLAVEAAGDRLCIGRVVEAVGVGDRPRLVAREPILLDLPDFDRRTQSLAPGPVAII